MDRDTIPNFLGLYIGWYPSERPANMALRSRSITFPSTDMPVCASASVSNLLSSCLLYPVQEVKETYWGSETVHGVMSTGSARRSLLRFKGRPLTSTAPSAAFYTEILIMDTADRSLCMDVYSCYRSTRTRTFRLKASRSVQFRRLIL